MLIRKRVVPLNSAPPRTVKELERLAKSSVPKAYWSYLSCGAGQELTVKENTAAYDRCVPACYGVSPSESGRKGGGV